MRRAGILGVVLVIAAACGARTPLIVDENCHGQTLPVEKPIPTIYLVLDHSLSMQKDDRWGKVRTALANVIAKVNNRASFATVIFPTPGGDSCSLGVELQSPAPGGAPATVATFLQVTQPNPAGGTPTAATLLDLAKKLQNRKDTFIVLATDGGPNCNAKLACQVDTCILNIEALGGCMPNGAMNCCANSPNNCLDDLRAIDAVKQIKANGITTYIVGIPGSEVYGPVLDAMAVEGGTARASTPKYWRVESTDALSSSLLELADTITKRCTLTLTVTPRIPLAVRVSVDDVLREREVDWKLAENTLTLFGQTCADFDGNLDRLHVEDGCLYSGKN